MEDDEYSIKCDWILPVGETITSCKSENQNQDYDKYWIIWFSDNQVIKVNLAASLIWTKELLGIRIKRAKNIVSREFL